MNLEQMENALTLTEAARDTLRGREAAQPNPDKLRRVRVIVADLLDDLDRECTSLPWAVQCTIERLAHELGMYYPNWGR